MSRSTSAPTSSSRPPSSASRQRPIAARRSPNGSREPVGRWPSAKATVRLSILSAAESTRPASVSGSGPPAASGRYCSSIAAQTASGSPPGGVLRADVALEVGELAHELGGLVGLR